MILVVITKEPLVWYYVVFGGQGDMRHNKKLVYAVCGVISLMSIPDNVVAQTNQDKDSLDNIEDNRPVKGGVPAKQGRIRQSDSSSEKSGSPAQGNRPSKGGTSNQKPSKNGATEKDLNCSWLGSYKIAETNCSGVNKKVCIGDVSCTEGSSPAFRSEASCTLGKAGVASCSDATACAVSPTGVGTEDCNIKYYAPPNKSGSDGGSNPSQNNSKGGAR